MRAVSTRGDSSALARPVWHLALQIALLAVGGEVFSQASFFCLFDTFVAGAAALLGGTSLLLLGRRRRESEEVPVLG